MMNKSLISSDTNIPLYKYMPILSFMSFIENSELIMNKISSWPDKFEGGRFKFSSLASGIDVSDELSMLYGSSWCMHNENIHDYKSETEWEKGVAEIENLGTASMWETYCQNGGVRIKTTLPKILNAFSHEEIFCLGKVIYEPSNATSQLPAQAKQNLLHKRVCFRHENEYRIIIKSQNQVSSQKLDLIDFIDEILVSPNTKNDAWKSRAIYKYATNCSFANSQYSSNNKNNKQLCRISNLYGAITEEIG